MLDATNTNIAAVVAVCCTLAAANAGDGSSNAIIETKPDQNTVSYSDHDYYFEYKIGPKIKTSSILTISSKEQYQLHDGPEYWIFLLSNADTQKFVQIYGRSDPCPADFLNAHLQPRILFPANDDIRARLADLPKGSTQDSYNWHRIEITGHCITDFSKGQRGDRRLHYDANIFDDCFSFLIEDFQIGERGDIL